MPSYGNPDGHSDGTQGERPASVVGGEEQYQLLVAYVRDYAIFSTDARGIIRSWNEGVRTVLGYGVDEFVGRPTAMIFTEEDVASGVPARELSQAAESGTSTDDRWLRRRNGERFWASGITTAIRDEHGVLLGFSKVLRDHTERKLSDEALRASEERMQLAATAARLGTWDHDPATGIFVLDPRCRDLLGLGSSEQVDLEALLGRIGSSYRDEARTAISRALERTGGRCDLEVPAADEARWLRITGRAYFNDARAIRLVGTAQDITQRKGAELARDALFERERAARTEAEAANRLKDEFLSTLSHELRTPLNAIVGYVRLLREGHLEGERRTHALRVIERNALTQTRLIEDILDVSRMMRGVLRLDVVPAGLAAVVDQAVEVMLPAITAKQLRLTWTPPDDAPMVLGDPDRLAQVVTNVLGNAVKFTPAGGSIEVSVGRAGRDGLLVVRDSGIGITPEFLPRVFERFRQADARRSRAHGGLGLGLSIVRHLVELHGGTVSAESDGPDQGATFTVRLPLLDAAAPPPLPLAGATSPGTRPGRVTRLDGIRLVAVDDDADALELMRHVLEHRGAQVTVATSAERALHELQLLHPHVLISDIGMPEVDGLELIRQVRERNIAVPAIAVTAYARTQDVDRALEAGYQDHVRKPIDWDLLVDRIVALSPPAARRHDDDNGRP